MVRREKSDSFSLSCTSATTQCTGPAGPTGAKPSPVEISVLAIAPQIGACDCSPVLGTFRSNGTCRCEAKSRVVLAELRRRYDAVRWTVRTNWRKPSPVEIRVLAIEPQICARD